MPDFGEEDCNKSAAWAQRAPRWPNRLIKNVTESVGKKDTLRQIAGNPREDLQDGQERAPDLS
jgi:hypothetical protein